MIPDYPMAGPPDITLDDFRHILSDNGSPSLSESDAMYDACLDTGVSPVTFLAFFNHESKYGKLGICATYDTRNPGNVRSPEDPSLGEIISTRGGPFAKYPTWQNGALDWGKRIRGPKYAGAGLTTVRAVLPKYAPTGDNNDPEAYIRSVLSYVEANGIPAVVAEQVASLTATTSPPAGAAGGTMLDTIGQRLTDRGLEVHDLRGQLARGGPYPKISRQAQQYTAIHYTGVVRSAGSLELDVISWQGHARYHVDHHHWPGIAYCLGVSLSGRVFLLHEVEEMGYHAYAANAVSFPVSVDMGGQEPSEAALRALAAVVDVLHNDTPELPTLNSADTYGHKELTFLDKRNITPCPGSLLPYVQRYRADGAIPEADPETVTFPTGITMNTSLGFYQSEAEGGVPEFGYPITNEFEEDGQTVQYFERARLEYIQDGSILRGLVGSEAYAGRYGPDTP